MILGTYQIYYPELNVKQIKVLRSHSDYEKGKLIFNNEERKAYYKSLGDYFTNDSPLYVAIDTGILNLNGVVNKVEIKGLLPDGSIVLSHGNKRLSHKRGDIIGNNNNKYITDAISIRERKALFECECGKEFIAVIGSIKTGNIRSCGCKKLEPFKIKYNEGEIIKNGISFIKDMPSETKRRKALFKCYCGKEFIATIENIKGHTKSCGCAIKKGMESYMYKHGMNKSTEHKSWTHIKDRCYNPNNKSYKYYGGRGITVCDRWLESFENFFEDMGLKPDPTYSIERENVDGNYEPNNCVWANRETQANNKRNNVIIEFNGEKLSLSQWARKIGVSDSTIAWRLKKGMTIEYALTKKLNSKRNATIL